MKTCFILTHIPNPRFNKRIAIAKSYGKTTVICAKRQSQDVWRIAHHDVPHTVFDVDLPSSAHPIRRALLSFRFLNMVYKPLNAAKPDLIYCGGVDTLLLANLYVRKNKNVRIIYEVADLRESVLAQTKRGGKIKRLLIMRLERWGTKRISGLILTSERFYNVYYHRFVPQSRVFFIPNIPDLSAFRNYRPKKGGPFTIGFIGGIRYLNQMRMLVDAAEVCGVHVLFAGAGFAEADYEAIITYCRGKPHVEFTGKYNYDEEIASLYGCVNCVYAVYDADNPNVQIALPNKLYESIYCELPIIVSKNTYLSEIVEEWNVGISVSHKDAEDLVKALKRLSSDSKYYDIFVNSCKIKKSDINLNLFDKVLKTRFEQIHENSKTAEA